MQRVQNTLARVVCRVTRFQSNSKSLLKRLHWLPIAERIQVKIGLLKFKALKNNQPSYLNDLLTPKMPTRSTRYFSKYCSLVEPRMDSENARRSFAYTAPRLWNALPEDLKKCSCIKTFCGKLKTQLFPT